MSVNNIERILEKLERRTAGPFAWGTKIPEKEVWDKLKGTQRFWSSTWSKVIQTLYDAFAHFLHGEPQRCRELFVECYMHILEVPGFVEEDCDHAVLRDYKDAVKHVLDSSWLFVVVLNFEEKLGVEDLTGTDLRHVRLLLKKLIYYDQLPTDQKSATLAIRAECEDRLPESHVKGYNAKMKYISESIALNPQEGFWYTLRGSFSHVRRGGWGLDCKIKEVNGVVFVKADGLPSNELADLRKGWKLRPCPLSCGLLAMAHMEFKKGFPEGVRLAREGLHRWPQSVYILCCAAQVYMAPSPFQNRRKSLKLMEKSGFSMQKIL